MKYKYIKLSMTYFLYILFAGNYAVSASEVKLNPLSGMLPKGSDIEFNLINMNSDLKNVPFRNYIDVFIPDEDFDNEFRIKTTGIFKAINAFHMGMRDLPIRVNIGGDFRGVIAPHSVVSELEKLGLSIFCVDWTESETRSREEIYWRILSSYVTTRDQDSEGSYRPTKLIKSLDPKGDSGWQYCCSYKPNWTPHQWRKTKKKHFS